MKLTLYRGGHVYAPGTPRATALLVESREEVDGPGHVVWVGTDEAGRRLAAPDTEVDLRGALVTPAFVDAHVHVTAAGLALIGLDLRTTRSLAAALDELSRAASPLPSDALVTATGWDETCWPEQRPPTPAELERAAGGRPVHFVRVDGHSAVATAPLLRAAGLAADTVLVQEADADAVQQAAAQAMTSERRRAAQAAALTEAGRLGIASLHEMTGPALGGEEDLVLLRTVAAEQPGPEVVAYWAGDVEDARRLGAQAGGDLFVDGSLGSRSAALREPYADRPDTAGDLRLDVGGVVRAFVTATRAGLQTGFHAIGDRAVATVLAGAEAAAEQVGAAAFRATRHRIEHVSLPEPAAIEAMARLGLVAGVQPAFAGAWGAPDGMYDRRLGRDRAARVLPLRAFASAGVPLAFGSDAPVTPLDPWGGVRDASSPRLGERAISVRAAFAAATRGGRRAARQEGAGDLRPGTDATFAVWAYDGDLVVRTPDARVAAWSTDPRAATPGLPELPEDRQAALPRCLRTVVAGRIVHDVEALGGG